MKFYIRKLKQDFANCNITITNITDDAFQLSWYGSNSIFNAETNKFNLSYSTVPEITDYITISKILTEKKTNLPLNNPHQFIACGIPKGGNSFAFVDVLKYTYTNKGSIGNFKSFSNIEPIMYILVPFADASINEWKFIAVANSFIVNENEITETFDIDIDRSIFDVCNENLPNIALSKQDTIVSAQLKNADGSNAAKANVDIYFETTAGYLTKTRSKTNEQGVATTELIDATEGKVKAGFKYFSGKAELAV